MGQTLSTNSGYFNSIKKKFWSRSTRIAREDFAREKEPEKMGWIRMGEINGENIPGRRSHI